MWTFPLELCQDQLKLWLTTQKLDSHFGMAEQVRTSFPTDLVIAVEIFCNLFCTLFLILNHKNWQFSKIANRRLLKMSPTSRLPRCLTITFCQFSLIRKLQLFKKLPFQIHYFSISEIFTGLFLSASHSHYQPEARSFKMASKRPPILKIWNERYFTHPPVDIIHVRIGQSMSCGRTCLFLHVQVFALPSEYFCTSVSQTL